MRGESGMGNYTYKNPMISHEKVIDRRKITPMHYHDEHELYYLINGKMTYYVEDKIYHMKKGDFIFIPKEVRHKTDSEDCMVSERMLVTITDDTFDDKTRFVLEELAKCKIIYIPQNNLYEIEELFHKLEQEYCKEDNYKTEMIKLYSLEIIIQLCRLKRGETEKLSDSDKIMISVAEYISENFSQNLSLKSLSGHFAMSESHLSRKFKKVMGMGINEYITSVRIKHAEKLLHEKTYRLIEISEKCGFNDSNYFSSVFKSIKGVTPYKYLQGLKN